MSVPAARMAPSESHSLIRPTRAVRSGLQVETISLPMFRSRVLYGNAQAHRSAALGRSRKESVLNDQRRRLQAAHGVDDSP